MTDQRNPFTASEIRWLQDQLGIELTYELIHHTYSAWKVGRLDPASRYACFMDSAWAGSFDTDEANSLCVIRLEAGRLSAQVIPNLARSTLEAELGPSFVEVRSISRDGIYVFFKDTSTRTITLCEPTVSFKIPRAAIAWPDGDVGLFVSKNGANASEPFPEVTVVKPQTLTSDFLLLMYELACRNDPKQQILSVVEKHLLEYGYDLSGCR